MSSNFDFEFVCQAAVLKDAIDITNGENLLFLPNNEYLVISNTFEDNTTTYSVLSKEVFSEYSLSREITDDDYAKEEIEEDLPLYAIEKGSLSTLLSKISGNVKLSFEKTRKRGVAQFIIIKDQSDLEEKHEGKLKMLDRDYITNVEGGLEVGIDRSNARFIEFMADDEIALSKVITEYPFAILELDGAKKFSPIILGKGNNQSEISIRSRSKLKIEMLIKTVSAVDHEYSDLYNWKPMTDQLAEGKQLSDNKKHSSTRFKIISNSELIQSCLKKHKVYPKHFAIVDVGEDEYSEFVMFFISRKDFSSGYLYTISTLEPEDELTDLYDDDEEEAPEVVAVEEKKN